MLEMKYGLLILPLLFVGCSKVPGYVLQPMPDKLKALEELNGGKEWVSCEQGFLMQHEIEVTNEGLVGVWVHRKKLIKNDANAPTRCSK